MIIFSFFQQIIIIQKYYRRWLAQRYVIQVRDDKAKRLEWEREEEIRKKKEKEDRIRREFERRMNPSSKEDFDLLYHAALMRAVSPYYNSKIVWINRSIDRARETS